MTITLYNQWHKRKYPTVDFTLIVIEGMEAKEDNGTTSHTLIIGLLGFGIVFCKNR